MSKRMFRFVLGACFCQIMDEDEIKRESSEDATVPHDFTPIDKINHHHPDDLVVTHY